MEVSRTKVPLSGRSTPGGGGRELLRTVPSKVTVPGGPNAAEDR